MLFELWFQQPVIGIPHDHRASDLLKTRNNFTRLWASGGNVSKADDLLYLTSCDSIKHSIKGNEIPMDIRDDGDRHGHIPLLASLDLLIDPGCTGVWTL